MLLQERLGVLDLVGGVPEDVPLDEEHGLGEGVLVVLPVGEEGVVGVLKVHDALVVRCPLGVVPVLDQGDAAEAMGVGAVDADVPSVLGRGLPEGEVRAGVDVQAVAGVLVVILVLVDDASEHGIPLHVPLVGDERLPGGDCDGIGLGLAPGQVDQLVGDPVAGHVERELRIDGRLDLLLEQVDYLLAVHVPLRCDVLGAVAHHVAAEGLADVRAEVADDHVAVGVYLVEIVAADVVVVQGLDAPLLGEPCRERPLEDLGREFGRC